MIHFTVHDFDVWQQDFGVCKILIFFFFPVWLFCVFLCLPVYTVSIFIDLSPFFTLFQDPDDDDDYYSQDLKRTSPIDEGYAESHC